MDFDKPSNYNHGSSSHSQQILLMLNKDHEDKAPTQSANAGIMQNVTTNTVGASWIVDSGASNHMKSNLKLLHNCNEVSGSEMNQVHLPTWSVVITLSQIF